VVIPLNDPGGNPVGVVGRSLPDADHPVRWLYSRNSLHNDLRNHILGLDRLINLQLEAPPVLVEGPFDVILGQQAGISTCSAHGTSFTQEQALLLRAHDANALVLAPDGGDTEAQSNMVRSAERHKTSLPNKVYRVELPPATDPAELVRVGPRQLLGALSDLIEVK
jgi:DNA primase